MIEVKVKVALDNSQVHHRNVRWVLVHHDWDCPWQSQYPSKEALIRAARNEPDSEAFRVVPRPLPKGATRYAHREF